MRHIPFRASPVSKEFGTVVAIQITIWAFFHRVVKLNPTPLLDIKQKKLWNKQNSKHHYRNHKNNKQQKKQTNKQQKKTSTWSTKTKKNFSRLWSVRFASRRPAAPFFWDLTQEESSGFQCLQQNRVCKKSKNNSKIWHFSFKHQCPEIKYYYKLVFVLLTT